MQVCLCIQPQPSWQPPNSTCCLWYLLLFSSSGFLSSEPLAYCIISLQLFFVVLCVCVYVCVCGLSSIAFFLNFYLFFYLCLCRIFVGAQGPSLVAASGNYSLVVVCGLLIVVASLGMEHRLYGSWAQ